MRARAALAVTWLLPLGASGFSVPVGMIPAKLGSHIGPPGSTLSASNHHPIRDSAVRLHRRRLGQGMAFLSVRMQEKTQGTGGGGERSPSYDLPYGQEVHNILTSAPVELLNAILIAISCALLAIETYSFRLTYYTIEDFICIVFILEYLARWYSRNLKPGYLLKWEMVFDFLSFLPFILNQQGFGESIYSGLTTLRLLRILRLQRFLRDVETFDRFVGSVTPIEFKVTDLGLQVTRIASQIFTLLFITSGLVYNAEVRTNENIDDFFSAFYCVLITMTTTGYGDIVPITTVGRFVMSSALLIAIGLIPYQLTTLASIFVAQVDERQAEQPLLECVICLEKRHLSQAVFCHRCGCRLKRRGNDAMALQEMDFGDELSGVGGKPRGASLKGESSGEGPSANQEQLGIVARKPRDS